MLKNSIQVLKLLLAGHFNFGFYLDYCVADELKHQLMNEHQKVADMQQELQGVGSNRQSVRELQEQIRDVQVTN